MKKYLVLIIAVMLAFSCNRKNSFTLTGTVSNPAGKYISVYRNDVNTSVLIDSARIGKNGKFRFRVDAGSQDFYQVGYRSDFVTVLAKPGEKIKLNFAGAKLCDNYTVDGSEGSSLIRDIDLKLIATKATLDSLTAIYEKEKNNPGFAETRGPELEQLYISTIDAQRKHNINFIIEHTTSLASIKALYQRINNELYVLYQTRDLQYLKIVSDSLKKYFPESNHTKALLTDFGNEMSAYYSRQLQEISGQLKETVLDPTLKDVNGKTISLSSLKGKYVLLTFWSISSRECISENLQLKEFYKTYSKKGFEIYQISIDADEQAWKDEVKFDELPWISTREDDPAKLVNARLYNVQSLPSNFLYDREGNIIATNLHGRALQLKLNQLFNI